MVKIGDIIRMNAKASTTYNYTKEGSIGVVEAIDGPIDVVTKFFILTGPLAEIELDERYPSWPVEPKMFDVISVEDLTEDERLLAVKAILGVRRD